MPRAELLPPGQKDNDAHGKRRGTAEERPLCAGRALRGHRDFGKAQKSARGKTAGAAGGERQAVTARFRAGGA